MVKASNKRRGVDSRKEWNRQKMVELSNEKIEEILHKETQKTEEKTTILRAVYTRYMRFYENYFDDIEALNDDKIAELRKYHEETRSFIKYYYMDIPYDICAEIIEFDDEYNAKLLGPDWNKYIFGSYSGFKNENRDGKRDKESLKAEFKEEVMKAFYEKMDSIFRVGFGTESETAEQTASGLRSLLFGAWKE